MQSLQHDNILKMVAFGNGIMKNHTGRQRAVRYITTDLATKGDFFDLVAETAPLEEKTARFAMGQLISAVKYMHAAGIAHRDLKLENILLDHQFKLKIMDFGFCAQIAGNNATGLLNTQLGT